MWSWRLDWAALRSDQILRFCEYGDKLLSSNSGTSWPKETTTNISRISYIV